MAIEVPEEIERLADDLAGSAGVVAVVIGGSRAVGAADEHSDWDLGVYYRDDIDLGALRRYGDVNPPGAWGRLMNGGAWLHLGPTRVDVLLRDLAAVEHWTAEAAAGRFAVDGLLGYVAGLPTYSLTAEAAIARPVHGSLDVPTAFPAQLATTAPVRWRFSRDFSLTHARSHAARGNVIGTVGQCARAVFEEAHARACEQHRWVLNEKPLLLGSGLDAAATLLAAPGSTATELDELVSRLHDALADIPAFSARFGARSITRSR